VIRSLFRLRNCRKWQYLLRAMRNGSSFKEDWFSDRDERERERDHRARKSEQKEREGGRNEGQRRRECWTGLGWDLNNLKMGQALRPRLVLMI
jgi:hypothetical protein